MSTQSAINRLFAAVLCLSACAGAQSTITLVAAPGTANPAPGLTIPAWMYNGSLPGPTLRGNQGETLHIRFINQTPEDSSIHWHGLLVPLGQDGVPNFSRLPVEPGQEYVYDLPLQLPGTYFYHSHHAQQLDRGLHGVLIVDPPAGVDPAYDEEIIVDLDDLLGGAPSDHQDPIYQDYAINGLTSAAQVPHMVDPGDVIRFRFVNSSSFTSYVVTVDGHQMQVTHADARKVMPVNVTSIPIGPGERYDAYVTANNPGTWSIAAASLQNPGLTLVRAVLGYNGTPVNLPPATYVPPGLYSPNRLAYSMLQANEPTLPLGGTPDRFYSLGLTFNPFSYTFTIGGQPFPAASALNVVHGETARISLDNFTGQYHPMHLHGHYFRLYGTAGGLTNPPLKDTVLVPPATGMGIPNVTFDVLADSPGHWPFHCHVIYHAENGMTRDFAYFNGDQDGDTLDDSVDLEPTDAHPVLLLDDAGGGWVPGSMVGFHCQWPQGSTAWYYFGEELHPALPQGAFGDIRLSGLLLFGTAIAGPNDVATVQAMIPAVPQLTGYRAAFQSLAYDASFSPPFRLSSLAILHVN